MNVFESPYSTPKSATIGSPCSCNSTVSLSVPSDLWFSVGSSPDEKMMFICHCCSKIYMGKKKCENMYRLCIRKCPFTVSLVNVDVSLKQVEV